MTPAPDSGTPTTAQAGQAGPELLPCPWCGGEPEIEPWHGGGPRKHMVSCAANECDVMPGVTGPTRAKAIAAWNRRLSSPAAPLSDADLQSVYDNAIHTALRQHHSLTGAEQHSIGLRALAALRGDGVREAAPTRAAEGVREALVTVGKQLRAIEREGWMGDSQRGLLSSMILAVDTALAAGPSPTEDA